MASQDTAGRQPPTAADAVRNDRVDGVGRAARIETARRRQQRGHGHSIEAQREHRDLPQRHAHHVQRRLVDRRGAPGVTTASENVRLITGTVAASLPGFAITTTSYAKSARASWRRNASRMRLLRRFRVTAPPTLRLTVRPRRGAAAVRCRSNTNCSVRRFSPVRPNAKNSRRRRIRAALGKPSPSRDVISAASAGSKRSAACGLWPAAASGRCDHQESPSERGSHGSAYGGCYSAEKFAS
jgi:hypothetical protein